MALEMFRFLEPSIAYGALSQHHYGVIEVFGRKEEISS